MKNYRFKLEPYSGMKSRYTCPNCSKKQVFTKYIDLHSNEYVKDSVGKCSRLIKCAYHYSPKQYFADNNSVVESVASIQTASKVMNFPRPTTTSYIDSEIMQKSIICNSTNYFIDFLTTHWNKKVAYGLVEKYHIGTSKYWTGATVFWQIDRHHKIRSGKVVQYHRTTGKRVKTNFPPIQWAHKVLKYENFILKQCFFGEHLLNTHKDKPVAIVESEKTAVIASVYLPEFVWLATGGLKNLNTEKCNVLKGRNVVLFPDLNGYELWRQKITNLTKSANYKISTLLEDKATQKERDLGLDLADYLLNLDVGMNAV